jgi:hypothetical protein
MSLSAMIRAMYTNRGVSGVLGTNVVRAAAADPQAAQQTIFTIAGGAVLVTGLYGIRTVIQAGGASNMQFRHSIGPTVLNVLTAITGNDVNTIYTITGNPNDAIQIGVVGAPVQGGMFGSQAVVSQQNPGIVMFTGNLQVFMSAAAGTGSTSYILSYVPLTPGSSVVAA